MNEKSPVDTEFFLLTCFFIIIGSQISKRNGREGMEKGGKINLNTSYPNIYIKKT